MEQYTTYGALDSRDAQGSDVGFVGFNNRLRPDQLKAGFVEICENGRLDRNGEWTLRKGVFNLIAPVTNDSSALAVNFGLRDTDFTGATKALGTDSNLGSLVITATGHNYPVADNPIILNLQGLSDVVPATSDGLRPVTVIDNNTFKLTDKTYTNAGSNTVTITQPTLTDTLDVKIRGGGVFSDPNSASNENYIILALTTSAKAVKMSDITATPIDIEYPTNEKVTKDCQVLQAFNKVFIFRKGEVAFEIDLAENNIASGSSLQMDLVANGDFSQPQTIVASKFSITDNVCSIESSNHGLKVGDIILCTDQSNTELIQNSFRQISNIDSFSVEPQEYTVKEVTDANNFKFTVGQAIPDAAESSSSPKFIKRVFSDLGFIHMPCPEFAELHNRRLIMPYQFDQSGDSGAPVITSRKVFDQLIVSDILDTDTYDRIFASKRFNAGTNDFTVGIKSFAEDKVLVFNRNSVHALTGAGEQKPNLELISDEVGCVARQSIVQVANNVFFLSDNGVYSFEFFNEYNLRGSQTPLSEPISKTIDRINRDTMDKSVAVYFNNRYYIAVPIDGSDHNNVLLVYNFINKAWESIDFVNSTNSSGVQSTDVISTTFRYDRLFVAGRGRFRGVYVVDENGGITIIEGSQERFNSVNLQGKDLSITRVGQGVSDETTVQGKLKTRMHTFGDLNSKKFRSFGINAESGSDAESNFSIKVQTENIDIELDETSANLGFASDYLGKNIPESEDVSFNGRIGNMRAYGAQLQIENTLGKPKIKTIKITASKSYKTPNPSE